MSNSKLFECPRCDYTSNQKVNLIKHLKIQKPCVPTKDNAANRNVAIEELTRKEANENTIYCKYCNKQLHKTGISRHNKICKAKNKLNNFGNEYLSHITQDDLKYTILNPLKGTIRMTESIYFNPNIPSNHNIRHVSSKRNVIKKHVDGTWYECDASNIIDEVIKKIYRLLHSYYEETTKLNVDILEDEIQNRVYNNFRFLTDTNSLPYFSVRRELKLYIRQKTSLMFN